MNIDPYLYTELTFYLADMAERGDATARKLLDRLTERKD